MAKAKPKPNMGPPCCEGCDIQVEESNTGGFHLSHPGRSGRVIGSFQKGENVNSWLETVHVQEGFE